MGEKITKMDRQPIISAKDVEITFSLRGKKLNAIRKCSLDLYDGETLAIVGESGSGKSVFTKTFVGMLDVNGKITGGSILYEGRDMTKFTEKDWLGVRGKKIAMVFQDPMTSLNPVKTVGEQIREVISYQFGTEKAEAKNSSPSFLSVSSLYSYPSCSQMEFASRLVTSPSSQLFSCQSSAARVCSSSSESSPSASRICPCVCPSVTAASMASAM